QTQHRRSPLRRSRTLSRKSSATDGWRTRHQPLKTSRAVTPAKVRGGYFRRRFSASRKTPTQATRLHATARRLSHRTRRSSGGGKSTTPTTQPSSSVRLMPRRNGCRGALPRATTKQLSRLGIVFPLTVEHAGGHERDPIPHSAV